MTEIKQGQTWENKTNPEEKVLVVQVTSYNEQGQKHDQAKPRFSLIPHQALWQVVAVLEFGAKKYGTENWRGVENARQRYFDACHRHLNAWWQGESVDDESGLPHLAHAVCCLIFLMSLGDK